MQEDLQRARGELLVMQSQLKDESRSRCVKGRSQLAGNAGRCNASRYSRDASRYRCFSTSWNVKHMHPLCTFSLSLLYGMQRCMQGASQVTARDGEPSYAWDLFNAGQCAGNNARWMGTLSLADAAIRDPREEQISECRRLHRELDMATEATAQAQRMQRAAAAKADELEEEVQRLRAVYSTMEVDFQIATERLDRLQVGAASTSRHTTPHADFWTRASVLPLLRVLPCAFHKFAVVLSPHAPVRAEDEITGAHATCRQAPWTT